MTEVREATGRARRLGPDQGRPAAVVIDGFLGAEACRRIADLASELFHAGELVENVFQNGSWFANVDRPETPRPEDARWRLVQALHRDVLATLGIAHWGPDTYLKDFVSYLAPGGFVVRHRDDWRMSSPEFDCRVRCNVFVLKEPGSGDPCLGPAPRSEDEGPGARELRLGLGTGDLLVFSPSDTPHRATRVLGSPKIMVSFGLEVARASFEEALARLA
jgi:hypothetical protein